MGKKRAADGSVTQNKSPVATVGITASQFDPSLTSLFASSVRTLVHCKVTIVAKSF